MPILLLLYPKESPEYLTSISLAIVFFNAFSGSLAYSRMKRIDYRSGLIFSTATIPGAILGAYTVYYINRDIFNLIFGILLIIVSVYLILKPISPLKKQETSTGTSRTLIDFEGTIHSYSFSSPLGIIISLFVGFLSSMLGIGGGIIHVPALVNLLNFPVHIATATSHFILAIMAFTGSMVHLINGTLSHGFYLVLSLGIGVLIGAQYGAKLSTKIHGKWIIRGLAIALMIVGIRILFLSI